MKLAKGFNGGHNPYNASCFDHSISDQLQLRARHRAHAREPQR